MQRAIEHYNNLFDAGQLNFQDFSIEDLPNSTKLYLAMWVKYFGLPVKLHQPVFENVYLFSISHPIVRFLIHNPSNKSHMWGDKKFENIDNNQALTLLAAKEAVRLNMPPDNLKDIFDKMDEINNDHSTPQ